MWPLIFYQKCHPPSLPAPRPRLLRGEKLRRDAHFCNYSETRKQKWQRNQLSHDLNESRSFQAGLFAGAFAVVVSAPICEILIFAVSAFVNLPTTARFQELGSLRGRHDTNPRISSNDTNMNNHDTNPQFSPSHTNVKVRFIRVIRMYS